MKYGEIMKKILIYLLILFVPFMLIGQVNAETSFNSSEYVILGDKNIDPMDHTCKDLAPVLRFLGYLLIIVKVAVPIIIIVKSSINLISAVTGGTPDVLKKQASKLVTSCIAGIAIFFIPTIIDLAMGLVTRYQPDTDDLICKECIFSPTDTVCSNAIGNKTDER